MCEKIGFRGEKRPVFISFCPIKKIREPTDHETTKSMPDFVRFSEKKKNLTLGFPVVILTPKS